MNVYLMLLLIVPVSAFFTHALFRASRRIAELKAEKDAAGK